MSHLDRIFKAYDIRGRTDTGDLTSDVARAIGLAFGTLVDEGAVAVGRDARPSSPVLAAALVDGLLTAGVDVLDLGMVTTDTVYHVSGSESVAGVMVTASHNPGPWNGVKLCRSGARPVGGSSGLADVRQLVAAPPDPAAVRGTVRTHDGVGSWVAALLDLVPPETIGPRRVVVDAANGVAGIVAVPVFAAVPAEIDGVHLEPDGTFPNHPADPLDPANLADVRHRVREVGADLGAAFDGDGDRVFFVDELGEILTGSTTTAILARWFLTREPGATVVHNLICSRAVPELVVAAGGVAVRTPVGHSNVKAEMARTDAVFGGEHSGHFYFRDAHGADTGILAVLALLRVLTEDGRPLSALRREVERYVASGEVNLTVADPDAAMALVERSHPDTAVDHLDGLTVDLGDAWFNVRPSNTEPLLRLNVEAPTTERVATVVEAVRSSIDGPRPGGTTP